MITAPQWAVTAAGEEEAAGQHPQDHGHHDQDGEGVVHMDLACFLGSFLLSGLILGTALGVQLQQIFPQDMDGQQAAGHGGEGDDEGVEADGGQRGHDLIVCPQLRPQSDNEDQKGGGLKASQPGHGAGLDGGAGAQKGAQSHQSQIDREVQKGAGQLLQRDQLSFRKWKAPHGRGRSDTMIPQRRRKVYVWMPCGTSNMRKIPSERAEAFLRAGAVVQ